MTAHPAPSGNHTPTRRLPAARALIAAFGTVVVWNGIVTGALLIWAWILIPSTAETSVEQGWATISALIVTIVGLAAVALAILVGLVLMALRTRRLRRSSDQAMSTRAAILAGTTSAAVGFAVAACAVLLFSLALSLS